MFLIRILLEQKDQSVLLGLSIYIWWSWWGFFVSLWQCARESIGAKGKGMSENGEGKGKGKGGKNASNRQGGWFFFFAISSNARLTTTMIPNMSLWLCFLFGTLHCYTLLSTLSPFAKYYANFVYPSWALAKPWTLKTLTCDPDVTANVTRHPLVERAISQSDPTISGCWNTSCVYPGLIWRQQNLALLKSQRYKKIVDKWSKE